MDNSDRGSYVRKIRVPEGGEYTLLTVDETAEVLGMSRASVYRLIKEGKVPHRKVYGMGVRFAPSDIDQILTDSYRPANGR